MIKMKNRIAVVVICMLLIFIGIPVSGTLNIDKNQNFLSFGTTLYVGGSGPGNYTKIQDAIDDSSDWDTIFVYDDSSPYFENILIDKSIILKGENRETTIIDSFEDNIIIYITEDEVTVSGFTIQNSIYDGILVCREDNPNWDNEIKNVTIYNNIIKNVSRGIFGITLLNSHIYNNYIEDVDTGIKLGFSSNNNVSYNFVKDADYRGINIHSHRTGHRILDMIFGNVLPLSKNNIIFRNTVEDNRWGIDISSGCIGTKIINNNIINNWEIGLEVYSSTNTEIKINNFSQTEKYIGYEHSYFTTLKRFNQFITNSWDGNYWSEPKSKPVGINGEFNYYIYIPLGITGGVEFNILNIPLIRYDRHPAQEPYEF